MLVNPDGSLQRIDPETVPHLLVEHHVSPTQGVFILKGSRCCCLLGILAVHALDGDIERAYRAYRARSQGQAVLGLSDAIGIDADYGAGLSDGWENTPRIYDISGRRSAYSPAYLAGFEDGKAAFKAVIDAGIKLAL